MSKADDIRGVAGRVLVFAIVALSGGGSQAAEVAGAPRSPPSTAAPQQLQAIGVNVAAPSGYQLRCWQQGRLVIDERGVQVNRELAGEAEPSPRATGSPQVTLLARGSAVCLMKPLALPASGQRRPE